MASRQRFYVALKEGETTIVSWKKLVASARREVELGLPSAHVAATSGSASDAAAAPGAPVMDPATHQAPNRLTAVIERIGRMFQGEDSDDENDDSNAAGDGQTSEDRYDTDDSFIDDEELDNYFAKEKIKTKHSGFFIHRGALERISEPSPVMEEEVVPHPALKKKRAESKKNKAPVPLPLEGVVPKQRKLKEPGTRKKREPNGSKGKLVQEKEKEEKEEKEQGECQNSESSAAVEPKKSRKRKEAAGVLKESKRNKKSPVREQLDQGE